MSKFFDPDTMAPRSEREMKLKSLGALSPLAQSTDWKKLPAAAFDTMERACLAEARRLASTSGRLFETRTRTDAGRVISTYEGDADAWLKQFKQPGMTIKINHELTRGANSAKARGLEP
ncbi:MAG: hypothetical protein ACLPXB_00345 [Thiobacillaceae bacterium]